MSASTLPLPPGFFHAVLTVLARHPEGLRRRDVHQPVADLMRLTPELRAETLPSGAHRYKHRMGWAYSMLKTCGYAESAGGQWKITPSGRALLAEHPNGFSPEMQKRIYKDARRSGGGGEEVEEVHEETAAAQQPPEERIDAALAEMQAALARDLRERIMQSSPDFFEDLVLDLLRAAGYGTEGDDKIRVGRTGDGGIDGIIYLDKLGLEKVYVQAKRWQNNVGRPDIQAFYGALAGRRAKKGVFITTSTFTRDAREFGEQVSDSIVLVDGARLTSLMIEHQVGVTHFRVVRLPRVDGDYFEAE